MSEEKKEDKPKRAMTPTEESIAIAKIKTSREPHPLQLLKQIRIDIAETITALRASRKNFGLWKEYQLAKLIDRQRKEFRRLHIVYCEFRGRAREVIEQPSKNPKKARSNMLDKRKLMDDKIYWGIKIDKWNRRHRVRTEIEAPTETDQDQSVEVVA